MKNIFNTKNLVYILVFAVAVSVVAFAVWHTDNEPTIRKQQSSAFIITDNDAKQITKLVKDAVLDCGTWGFDSTKINKDNADKYESLSYKIAANLATADEKQKTPEITSRADKRTDCMAKYVSNMSPMMSEESPLSPRDALMNYNVKDSAVNVSDPKNSKLTINLNSRPALTVTARWTSLESGLYQKHKMVKTGATIGDRIAPMPDGWAEMSKVHDFTNVKFYVERQDSKWKIVSITGAEWDSDGYVNVLASKVSRETGAKRLLTPEEINGYNKASKDGNNNNTSSEPSSNSNNTKDIDNMKNKCVNPDTGKIECDADGNPVDPNNN